MTIADPDPDEILLPWSYWDGTVETELRANEYPYADASGSGVQITLGCQHNGQIVAVRLPSESAMRLALAILGSMTPPPLADDPVAKRLGLVP